MTIVMMSAVTISEDYDGECRKNW